MHTALDRVSDLARCWSACARLTADSHSVAATRLLGLTGAVVLPANEGRRMVQEKLPAFTEATVAGAMSALSGRSPDRVLHAFIHPLSREARSNRERLGQRPETDME